MYRLNNLQRNVLITPDEVIFHGPVDHTFDHRKIEHAIIIAEERFIRPAMTYEFYEQIAAEKNRVITSLNLIATETAVNASFPSNSAHVTLQLGDIVNSMSYLSEANLKLWKQHLWKLIAECVLLMAMPDAFVQMSSTGAVHANPAAGAMSEAKIVTPELRSVKWTMDKKMMDRIDPLTEAMHLFICKNISLYPNYDRACDCNSKGVAYKRKSNWVTGIYDDEPRKSCCAWDQLNPYS